VNLHLAKGAVLRCPTDMKHFPEQRTRIEGHFEDSFNPALVNADGCDGLQITGEGTLDGAGRPIWDKFWASIKANRKFKNLDLPRARLCLLENSKNVTVRGITFKDSQFWNLHLYNCEKVLVEKVRFQVPDDYKQAPSSDGVDVDSCRDVVIRDCWFSVTDDCIALKGTKGPFALEDKSSPPVENVRVTGCVFKRGHQGVSCGSEATIVRNIIIENCTVKGPMPLFRGKLRPDTPQRYENITFRNIVFENGGASIFAIAPWTQYFDLKGQPAPSSVLKNVTVSGVTGELGSFGSIGGHDKAAISDITLENIDVKAKRMSFRISDKVKNVQFNNVKVNGEPYR
jgi:alpha-L-rhamnosidase